MSFDTDPVSEDAHQMCGLEIARLVKDRDAWKEKENTAQKRVLELEDAFVISANTEELIAHVGELEEKLSRAEEDADRLAEALKALKSAAWFVSVQSLMYAGDTAVKQVNEALAAHEALKGEM